MASESNNQKASKKKSGGGWIFILIALAIIAVITLKEGSVKVQWLNDYADGTAEAKKLQKPMLIVITSKNEKFADDCKNIITATYGSLTIAKSINKTYVPILLEEEKNKELVKKFELTSFPALIIENPESGKFIVVAQNYITHEVFPGRTQPALNRLMGKSK